MGKPFETDLTDVDYRVAEGATAVVGFTVQDEDGNALADTQLDACTYTLVVAKTGRVINSREDVDLLGAGGIDGAGAGTITLTPSDNAIVGGAATEEHELLVSWTWDTTKKGRHRVRIVVEDLIRVP